MTLAIVPVLVSCGWGVNPGAVTEIACALACPATKPTTSAFPTVGVTAPELAAVLVFDVPVDTSSGPDVARPENSCTANATVAADAVFTVTVVTDAALAEYHISPSELWLATL